MKVIDGDNRIILKDVDNFNSKHIFECGQCFRWEKHSINSYIGVVSGKILEVEQNKDEITIHNISLEEFERKFKDYFDLNRDYSKIKERLSSDDILKKAIVFGDGIRILNQEIWECLVSFILSANNRIPMIKRAIKNISQRFGKKIIYKGNEYYSFPTPEELLNAQIKDFEECGAGFRAKYIKGLVMALNSCEIDLNQIENLSTESGRNQLQKISGVGPKIADCVLLFSAKKTDAFPTDVWVKRIMEYFYSDGELNLKEIQQMAKEKFDDLAGFAQQYLFYYARELKIGK